ncbi:unnamed protein product [Cochlearia groenlandica]
MMRRQHRDQDSRAFYDLSSLVLNLLRSPPPSISFSDQFPSDSIHPPMRNRPPPSSFSSPSMAQITPSGFASMLLGVSVALMMCGSLTFFIGFLLMPWVLALVMGFYVAGIVSVVSMAGRSLLCYVLPPPSSSAVKDFSEWKLM